MLAVLIAFGGKSLLELEHGVVAGVVRSALLGSRSVTE
jgi:hypothetical protein